MKITTNNITFKVDTTKSVNVFYNHYQQGLDKWEKDTYCILDLFKNNKGTLIDIGAWIGPISLYSSSLYKKVVAIEADPVAIEALNANIKCNDFKNICLIEKALSNINNSNITFGGNGPLGNSESSMLINEKDFLDYEGRSSISWKNNNNHKTIVNTINFETLISDLKLDFNEISLIKMDIEGGEKIVVPDLKKNLMLFNIPLFISLHPCYLQKKDIYMLVNMLFDIYNKCFYINSNKEKEYIKKEIILLETDMYYSIPNRLTMKNGLPGTRYFSLVFEK
tara:strand:+ start:14332 stop:15171 length:840 start_codon:yes stop_codon:yes gene_type:complete